MCIVCERHEAEEGGATLLTPSGAVAQLVERFDGIEEVARSIRVGSTESLEILFQSVAAFLGGFVAGEGCFSITGNGRRFVFSVTVAARDQPVLVALRQVLGVGAICRPRRKRQRWLPEVSLEVTGRRQHQTATVPFMDRWLPARSAKRRQFETWRAALEADLTAHPFRTAGTCSVDGCDSPIRGRGLCRRHYYLATGY